MKIKRKNILIIMFILLCLFIVGIFEYIKTSKNETPINIDNSASINIEPEQIELMQSLVGLESKDMKILDNPLRIEGSFYIPQETVLTYINHYLKKSNNKDIENVKVIINKNGMTISGKYKLLSYIKTPIDVDILPSITSDKDLKLELKDIRLLNLSLSDDIIKALAKSWFSDLKNIKVYNKNIVIDKNFFKNSEIKNISVKKGHLTVNMNVKFQ